MRGMARQLTLIDTSPPAWRIDERTRETGRKGVATARAALQAALAHPSDQPAVDHPANRPAA
jgi:hypothetical protein